MSQSNFLVRLLLIFIHFLRIVHIFAAESSTIPLTQNELRMRYGQENTTFNDGKSCYRICNGTHMTCYYELDIENFDTMSGLCGDCENGEINDCFNKDCIPANGIQRSMMAINRKLPGTAINVCKDDRIIVDIKNHLAGSEFSMHWHGLHQKKTPWMDGVPMVTQCPIFSGNSFRYVFDAAEPGTHYYHAHSGLHRTNGCVGKLNIREQNDPNAAHYDYDLNEHSILLSDWNNNLAETYAPGVRTTPIRPHSILINGFGSYFDKKSGNFTYAPMAVFYVEKGKRHRFRIDNAASHNCPLEFCIKGHNLTVIATDGYAVEPFTVDCVVSYPGERYDVVMRASNDPAINETLIVVRALGFCRKHELQEFARVKFLDDFAQFSLKYEDYEPLKKSMRPDYNRQNDAQITLNALHANCTDPKNVCIASLKQQKQNSSAAGNLRDESKYKVKKVFPFTFKNYFVKERPSHFLTTGDIAMVATINNIAFTGSPVPGLTQDDSFVSYCNKDNLPKTCDNSSICHCTHLTELELCKVYEFIFIDPTRPDSPVSHPIHLHGYGFQVIDMGTMEQYRTGQTAYANSTSLPVIKDTVAVPGGGFVKVRFETCNPGYWFFHCHFEFHMHIGMSAIFKVGDTKDMVPPPTGFPQCGNYLLPISEN